MVQTPSTMIELGTVAPSYRLPDTEGAMHAHDEAAAAPALLIMFICNHCPFVKHVRGELARIGRDYLPRGVAIFAISSNDAEAYPADGPAAMREERQSAGYPFPYLYDEQQDVARAYGAACTPDFFLFDDERRLVYRGQLDDSRPSNDEPVDGHDLRDALDAVLAGRPVSGDQKPSIGCNIKWKSGRARV